MYTRNLRLFTFAFVSILFLQSFAENNWNVPAEKKAKNSSIKFDAVTAKDGESIYTKNCVSCHGNPTQGNSLKSLSPIPPDLSSAKTQELTDGELFYILNTGRVIMPSFNNVLSEEDRWKVISYIRSFNKNYVQQLSKTDSNKSKLVKVDMSFDKKSTQITVIVKAKEKTGEVLLKDAQVLLFVTRYFGRLQIDDTQRTTVNGIAVFNFPKDLPGDKDGTIKLVVKIADDTYGEILITKSMKLGIPTDKPSLTANRAIWNVLAKAPLWIIFFYLSGVLAFAIVLLYLLNNLRKISKNGSKKALS